MTPEEIEKEIDREWVNEVTKDDVELETYIRKQCLRHGTYSTDDVRRRIAAHRIAAVAAREAEIVGMAQSIIRDVLEYEDYGCDHTAGALRTMIERIQTPSEGEQP